MFQVALAPKQWLELWNEQPNSRTNPTNQNLRNLLCELKL